MRGTLLVNLGTPDAPTPSAVRRYLREFLSDQRVVEIPRILWLPLLYGIILPLRAKRSAANYAEIWWPDGSPLRVITQDQAKALEHETNRPCVAAFRYGSQSIEQGIAELQAQGCTDIDILPMYPQFSATTTSSIFDKVAEIFCARRDMLAFRFIKDFPTQPRYISALCESVKEHWESHGRDAHLLLSFHGLPERNIELGDPYRTQCQETAELLAAELGLSADQWTLCFQSRFGKQKWIGPSTEDMLKQLGASQAKAVDVICPGFSADCLETLEEITISGQELFAANGGGELRYIPALNTRPSFIQALGELLDPANRP